MEGGEPPPTRQLIWEPSVAKYVPQGFDNAFHHLYIFMKLAIAAQARPVVPSPKLVMSRAHVESVSVLPEWWDGYFDAMPRLHRNTSLSSCVAPVETWDMKRLAAELELGNASAFLNPATNLCVRLAGNWKAELPRNFGGAEKPQLFASPAMAALASRAFDEIGPVFSSAHVRQFDKGTPPCVSAQHVVQEMASFGPRDRWFVASNGNSSWFRQLHSLAPSYLKGSLTTERDLPSLRSLKDNYMTYAVEKCIFGSSERLIDTYWDAAGLGFPGLANEVGDFKCVAKNSQFGKRPLVILCPKT